jgi:chromosome segregation ATPase
MKIQLERLTNESESFRGTIQKLEDRARTEQKEHSIIFKQYEGLEKTVKEKDKMIDLLNKEKESIELKVRKNHQDHINLYNNHQNMLMTHDSICSENKMLRDTITTLERELDSIKVSFEETQTRYSQYEFNYRKKENEIESFKESFENMKTKQQEITDVLEIFEQENTNLKKLLNEKKLYTEELIAKIEGLKLEFQDRIACLEREYDETQTQNKELQNKIDNIFKVKIRALKTKLKEKVVLISELERKYQYEKGKRGLY